MYRVMLIDDELPVRSLLRDAIDWDALGMEIAGEAESGLEAINKLDDVRPDIAIVDIVMPFMNGIEFTELATARYPQLIVIILTAHNEFEYARRCIRLHVFDYMLKPVNREEITEVLRKAAEKLDGVAVRLPVPHEEQPVPLEGEQTPIEQIEKYLRENYTDSKINLTSVAQRFGFNPSYLSRRFKQVTGQSFVEYLTECRMERAIELAGKETKMFCIAGAVGIPDPYYFGRCFKKYTGKCYSEYVAVQAKNNQE